MDDRSKRQPPLPWGTSKRSLKRRAIHQLHEDLVTWTNRDGIQSTSSSECRELELDEAPQDIGEHSSAELLELELLEAESFSNCDSGATSSNVQDIIESLSTDSSPETLSVGGEKAEQENSSANPTYYAESSPASDGLLAQISTENWYDALDYGLINYDCDICFKCRCIDCDVCVHRDEGCQHCDYCVSDDVESVFDEFSDVEINDEESPDMESSEDESADCSDPSIVNKEITNDFINLVLSEKLNHQQTNALLAFFRKYEFGKFPKCAKTLLKTPASYELREVKPGHYWHRGIEKDLMKYISETDCNEVHIKFSVDGLPIARSSGSSFWPILCYFNEPDNVVLAGVYHGSEKPHDSNDFLKDFVEEIQLLCENGIEHNGKKVDIFLACVVCDAPAKSLILRTKGHNAYHGCTKCTTSGKMYGRRMSYPNLNATLRTDESFIKQEDAKFHLGETILLKVPKFRPVSCVVLDYLHLVLLGIVRKIMYMWISGPLAVRLSQRLLDIISHVLMSLVPWTPTEFVRKPRSLKFIKRFKGTEFRQILFYSGPVIFKNVLREKLYDHFLILHAAMYILAHPKLSKEYLSYADELLRFWVERFKVLYGREFVSHNIHGVIHIAADVKEFGPLDSFSAFPFENFLQMLKKMIRKSEKPLPQLVRRFTETEQFGFQKIKKENKSRHGKVNFSQAHSRGPLCDGTSSPQFHSCALADTSLNSKSEANNCCKMKDDSVVIVKNFAFSKSLQCMVVIGKRFTKMEDLYTYPLKSSLLGIYYVYNLHRSLQVWPVSDISSKCYRIPFKDGFAVVPILHSG